VALELDNRFKGYFFQVVRLPLPLLWHTLL
jgi:hypothetical protein